MPPMSREMVCMAIDLRKEEELGNMKITDISVLYVAVHHVRGLSIVHTDNGDLCCPYRDVQNAVLNQSIRALTRGKKLKCILRLDKVAHDLMHARLVIPS